jgi:hypothetical protein
MESNAKAQKRLCDGWKHPVGTPVVYEPPHLAPFRTKTRSEPWMLGASSQSIGHTAVISIEGKSGGVALDYVRLDTEAA